MDELIKLVVKKVGIDEKQAKMAVETVLKFLKDKLPKPIASQIDGVLGGKGAGNIAGQAGDVLGGLGGLLGGGGKKKK